MLALSLPRAPRVLCVGAHCDDIEIGCGGTLLWLRRAYPEASIRWLVLSSDERREAEARASAERFLGSDAAARVRVERFRDGFLPYEGRAVKEAFESLKREPEPDLILTHWGDDAHQDHRLASELTWNTFRNHWILEYEIPKYDGDLGRPSVYVPLDEAILEAKVGALMDCYASQRKRAWFEPETFRSLARLRGLECCAPDRYAEAFHSRKLVVGAPA